MKLIHHSPLGAQVTGVPGGLITREYALEGLQYKGTVAARDADVDAYIKAATPIIEWLHGPILQTVKTVRVSGGKSAALIPGRIADADAVAAVRADGTPWTGYAVDADAGIVYAGSGRTFPDGVSNIELDVTVGYTEVPQHLQLAARELVRWWIQNGKQAPAAGTLNIPGGTDPGMTDEFAIPRRVRQLCAPGAGSGFA